MIIKKDEIMTSYQFIIISCALGGILASLALIYNVMHDILIVLHYISKAGQDDNNARETKE